MDKQTMIADLLKSERLNYEVTVKGWVKTLRNNRFIALNDGSCLSGIQVVIDPDALGEETVKRLNPGAAIAATGELVASQGKGQKMEIQAKTLTVYGDSDPSVYPLQPKKHSLEFLRSVAHLRFRTNTFGAVFRLRHTLAFAIHRFFNDRDFVYLNTPILSASDAEGAGEMFQVTTLNLNDVPQNDERTVDWSQDFFGKPANLTVSGQLEAELGALALSRVYTFGPTFRAENSNTSRHLAEFWMVEPEIAFADLNDNMNLAEQMLKYVVQYALTHNADDLEFLDKRLANEENQKPQNERMGMGLLERLHFCVDNDFERVSYTEAHQILRNSKPNKKKKFSYLIDKWGNDLQSEHERFLVEKHFKKPVILFDYPKDIKAFYMRSNDDGRTVAAMDVLFPGVGEIIGGSQREERLDELVGRMKEMNIPEEELYWYLDIRKYGSCPHAGYGLGFERLVQFVCGMGNIRDVVAFPRTPGSIAF